MSDAKGFNGFEPPSKLPDPDLGPFAAIDQDHFPFRRISMEASLRPGKGAIPPPAQQTNLQHRDSSDHTMN
jgi:hypothetical protein